MKQSKPPTISSKMKLDCLRFFTMWEGRATKVVYETKLYRLISPKENQLKENWIEKLYQHFHLCIQVLGIKTKRTEFCSAHTTCSGMIISSYFFLRSKIQLTREENRSRQKILPYIQLMFSNNYAICIVTTLWSN